MVLQFLDPGKFLEIATTLSNPLALAGLFATILFFTIRQLISAKIFPTLTRQLSSDIITLIIDRMYKLSIMAMCLGFLGFAIVELYADNDGITMRTIDGTVTINNKGVYGVKIKVQEIQEPASTNDYGYFKVEFPSSRSSSSYTFELSHPEINDTIIVIIDTGNMAGLKFHVNAKAPEVEDPEDKDPEVEGPEDKEVNQPTIKGQVLDHNDKGMANVKVEYNGEPSTLTNESGLFSLTLEHDISQYPGRIKLYYSVDSLQDNQMVGIHQQNIVLEFAL